MEYCYYIVTVKCNMLLISLLCSGNLLWEKNICNFETIIMHKRIHRKYCMDPKVLILLMCLILQNLQIKRLIINSHYTEC